MIRIGEVDAALVDSATLPGDFRCHAFYLSDGRRDYTLRIAGSSPEVLRVARTIYCGWRHIAPAVRSPVTPSALKLSYDALGAREGAVMGRKGRSSILLLIPVIVTFGCTRLPAAGATGAGRAESQAVVTPVAETRAGCIPPTLPADRPPSHDEVAGVRGWPIWPPMLVAGTRVDSIADPALKALAPLDLPVAPDGLPVQARLFDAGSDGHETDAKAAQQLMTVYSKSAVTTDQSIVDVLREGGAVFGQTTSQGQDAAFVVETIGDKAQIVRIGDLDAALVESTTMPGDFRTHALYWSDGRRDYWLKIAGSSEEVVRVGQALYCG